MVYTSRPEEAVTDKTILLDERTRYDNPAVSLSTEDMARYARRIWLSPSKGIRSSKKHKVQITLNNIYSVGEYASSARAGWISSIPSVEARERILYANFLKVNQEVKDMIAEIQEFYKKWGRLLSIQSKFTHNSSNLYCCKKKKSRNFAL